MANNRTIRSWFAYLVFIACLMAGFIWTSYKPAAPFGTFVTGLIGGLGIYLTKRIVQKMEKFGGAGGSGEEGVEGGEQP
jgi:xanthosine utilization system XapX-like protein